MRNHRSSPIDMNKQEFVETGQQLVDAIAEFISKIHERKVTPGESPDQLQQVLGDEPAPDQGIPANQLLARTTDLLLNHSLFNGHPKFLGYITSSPAPIGALADFLASAVNANVGGQMISPIATEIEKQTIRWLAEFIGVSPTYGGIMVSGGNMANFTAFFAAINAKIQTNFKEEGLASSPKKPYVYCSKAIHTWIEKAVIVSGLGTNAIRWIPATDENKMNIQALEQTIESDIENGHQPLIVVGTAGDVSTGAIDNFTEIATICKKHDIWFHIDGAYGIPAAIIPELKEVFAGIEEADSLALDPHKWLYSPLEAGCTLVKNPQHLTDMYSSHPEYYNFNKNEEFPDHNFYEYGLQNSRGFRALKVWLSLQQVGKSGYIKMIRDDIQLAKLLFDLANQHQELEAMTYNLSIATFRYVPSDVPENKEVREEYLNNLNESLLDELQSKGEVFLSKAVIDGRNYLRGCIVNFRTSKKDIEEIVEIVVREGYKIAKQSQQLKNE